MPARHSNFKQLALRVVHKHAKLAGLNEPRPQQKFYSKIQHKKLLTTHTYFLPWTKAWIFSRIKGRKREGTACDDINLLVKTVDQDTGQQGLCSVL